MLEQLLTAVTQDPRVNVELKERARQRLTTVPALPNHLPADTFQLAATLTPELESIPLPD